MLGSKKCFLRPNCSPNKSTAVSEPDQTNRAPNSATAPSPVVFPGLPPRRMPRSTPGRGTRDPTSNPLGPSRQEPRHLLPARSLHRRRPGLPPHLSRADSRPAGSGRCRRRAPTTFERAKPPDPRTKPDTRARSRQPRPAPCHPVGPKAAPRSGTRCPGSVRCWTELGPMTSAHDGAFCGQTRWSGCEYVSAMRRDMAPLLAIMLFKPCVPNVVLHLQAAGEAGCGARIAQASRVTQ